MNRIITYKERDEEGNVTQPTVMRCDCGEKIEIYSHHDVDCDRCHRSYNSAGQMLADRSQWGEETGEMACDYDRGAAGDHGMDEP